MKTSDKFMSKCSDLQVEITDNPSSTKTSDVLTDSSRKEIDEAGQLAVGEELRALTGAESVAQLALGAPGKALALTGPASDTGLFCLGGRRINKSKHKRRKYVSKRRKRNKKYSNKGVKNKYRKKKTKNKRGKSKKYIKK